jgi:hypothetical protein
VYNGCQWLNPGCCTVREFKGEAHPNATCEQEKREGESGDRSSTFPTCHPGKMIYELFSWNPRLNASGSTDAGSAVRQKLK